jgi:hypothetical protein
MPTSLDVALSKLGKAIAERGPLRHSVPAVEEEPVPGQAETTACASPRETQPSANRAAIRPRVLLPTTWMPNVRQFHDAGSWRRMQGPWLGAMHRIAKGCQPGDVPADDLKAVANMLAKAFREGGGKTQLSLDDLAKRAGASRSRTRAALGKLESAGLLDSFYVRERVEGVGVFPRPNLWLPRLPDPATDTLGPLDRMNASLIRWRTALGLEMHPWGLNGTPVSSRYRRPEV